jgi:hypothetical protein
VICLSTDQPDLLLIDEVDYLSYSHRQTCCSNWSAAVTFTGAPP